MANRISYTDSLREGADKINGYLENNETIANEAKNYSDQAKVIANQSNDTAREAETTANNASNLANEAKSDASAALQYTVGKYLEPVSTFSDIASTYPSPAENDRVQVRDTGYVYIYQDGAWEWFSEITAGPVNELDNRMTENLEGRGINVMYPPAPLSAPVADGATDDTTTLQAIADYANSINSPVVFPNKRYRIMGNLKLYTDVTCNGVFVVDSAETGYAVQILSNKTENSIDATVLGGLSEGSTAISGLPNLRGATLLLKSTEELIKRNNPPNNVPYTLTDSFVVQDNNGKVLPEVDSTYTDNTLITATYREKEDKTLFINGLSFEYTGATQGDRMLLLIKRSDVVANDLNIVNNSDAEIREMISVNDCAHVTLNKAKGSGARYSGYGYGITLANCSFVNLNNCEMVDCRHGITGKHAKTVRINGGIYMDDIDSHWGLDYMIENVKLIGAVRYAGKDITVRNSEIETVNYLLYVREDTPEIRGDIIFENLNVNFTGSSGNLFYITADTAFDWMTTFRVPDTVRFKNLRCNDKYLNLVANGSSGYTKPHGVIGKIVFDNIRSNETKLLTLYQSENQEEGTGTIVELKDIDFKGNSDDISLLIRESGSPLLNWGYELIIDRCKNINHMFDSNVVSDSKITESSIVRHNRRAGQTESKGDISFEKCQITGLIAGESYLNFYNCIFYGSLFSSSQGSFTDINSRIKIGKGNVAGNEVTYPLGNIYNYANPNFYQSS